jgi:hypothetical protein
MASVARRFGVGAPPLFTNPFNPGRFTMTDFDRHDDRQKRDALEKAFRDFKAKHSAAEAIRRVLNTAGVYGIRDVPDDRVAATIRALGGDAPAGNGLTEWPRLTSVAELDPTKIYAKWNRSARKEPE